MKSILILGTGENIESTLIDLKNFITEQRKQKIDIIFMEIASGDFVGEEDMISANNGDLTDVDLGLKIIWIVFHIFDSRIDLKKRIVLVGQWFLFQKFR